MEIGIAAALPQKKRVVHSRRLVLVDIENVAGGPRMSALDVRSSQREVERAALIAPDELVIVGSSHFAFTTAGFAWQGGRHVIRSGHNGADLALIGEMEIDYVSRRFSEVVLAAGDGDYADHVSALGSVGIDVTVVARPESLSRRLRMAAKRVIYLPSFEQKVAA